MLTLQSNKKLIVILLLALFSTGAVSTVSTLEMNWFVKGYGLLLVLQTGLACSYLGYRQWRRH